ncbi:MAG: beta-ketoacyl-[Lentisphaeria bacterium]|nr:beta-ketoacyl-[acyl-carrier-protein] synthase family protein [Lentisphaeria bacterium]
QAEVAALAALFPAAKPPLFSLKGNYGHTLGATGVLQLALGLELARRRMLPPQAGLRSPMPGANVATEPRRIGGARILSLNVGFGGINSAVALEAL